MRHTCVMICMCYWVRLSNHERSKKHKDNAMFLKAAMEEEEAGLKGRGHLDEPDSSADSHDMESDEGLLDCDEIDTVQGEMKGGNSQSSPRSKQRLPSLDSHHHSKESDDSGEEEGSLQFGVHLLSQKKQSDLLDPTESHEEVCVCIIFMYTGTCISCRCMHACIAEVPVLM